MENKKKNKKSKWVQMTLTDKMYSEEEMKAWKAKLEKHESATQDAKIAWEKYLTK